MSEFWKYFHDVLAWPLIHAPGPLQAVVNGAALAMDTVRDDIVYFRNQWFPALCEPELISDHGKSRGLVRHSKETPEQFRQRVVHAYAWHLLAGKTEGVPQILRFYGFDALRIDNLRQWQPSRWAEFQLGMATPTTQADQKLLLDDLEVLIWLVNEYKPARSVLARLYTDTYNVAPMIWSRDVWSDGFWSHFSGVPYGPDGRLIVSFGMGHLAASNPYITDPICAAAVRHERTCFLAPYLDKFFWGRSRWSEPYNTATAFVAGQVQYAGWPEDIRHWDMGRGLGWSRSQLMYADHPDHAGAGAYGDINACWGLPSIVHEASRPCWSAYQWSQQEQRRVVYVDERYQEPLRRAWDVAIFSVKFGAAVTARYCAYSPYVDHAVWGRSCWSDAVPHPHGFWGHQSQSIHWCDQIWHGGQWVGSWAGRPWAHFEGWDRPLAAWAMDGHLAWSRSQITHGDAPDADGSGSYGDVNATYSTPVAVAEPDTPRWSAYQWSQQKPRRLIPVEQRGANTLRNGFETSLPPTEFSIAGDGGHVSIAPYLDRPIWGQSKWSDRPVRQYGFFQGATACLHWCEPVWHGGSWGGQWDERPWGQLVGWDRPLLPCGVSITSTTE